MSAATYAPAAQQGGPPQPVGARRRFALGTPIVYLVAIVVIGLTVLPLVFVAIGGFRSNAQLNNNPAGLPHPWVFSNYTNVLTSSVFWHFLGNSAFIAAVATITAVVLGSMVSFALSRYTFWGREGVYTLFTLGLLFPLSVAALPLYLVLRNINLLENPFGVALPEAAFALPATVIILRPFMRAIPMELEDAAAIDGASRLGFFWRILLPLSRPALTTVSVLAFVLSWNQYILPLLVFNDQSHFTLPVGVAAFQSQYSEDTASVLAFTTLSMIPALIFLAFAERRIVSGLTGAVKG